MADVANGKPKNLIVPSQRTAFAERIKSLRQTAGLTQTELAKRQASTAPTTPKSKAGLHSVSIDRIFAIADALDASPGDLFTEPGNP